MLRGDPRSESYARTNDDGMVLPAVLGCFPHPVALLDDRGVVRAANQQLADMLCADLSSLTGRAWPQLVFRAQDGQASGSPNRQLFDETIRVLLRDGQAPRFVLESRRVVGVDGPWSGMSLVTLTDISALKESERAWQDLCTQVCQLSDTVIDEALRLRRGLNAAQPTAPPVRSPAHDSSAFRSWLGLALSPSVIRRGLAYGLIVGAILTLINHGDALLRGELDRSHAWQIGLTLIVPYMVSTLSSVGATRKNKTP